MLKRTMKRTLLSLRLPKPQTPKNHPPLFRHFTAEPSPPGSSCLPPSSESSSTVTQIVSILQTDENWRANDELRRLLFTTNRSTLSLSPSSLHKITLNLGTAEKGLNFFNFLRSNSPSPPLDPSSLAASLQAIFELAASEQRFLVDNLSQLYATYKEYNVPLTSYSAHLLIRCFAGAGQVKKSLSLYREFDPSLRNAQVSNFLLHVLLQSGRVEDAYQLLDEMPNPPNDSTVDTVMRAILWGKETGVSVSDSHIIGLVSKLGELGVFPTAVRLTQLINKLCKSRKLELAWDILHNVMNLGGDVQAPSCNALLTALSRYQHFDKMNQLMAHMKEKGIQPSVVTFGIIINRLGKGCMIDEALEVLEKMTGEGEIDVKPDTIVYNTVIDGLCKVGREEEGLALMEKMRLQQGCQPNTATYNCLIDGFCEAGEMEKARKLFDEMNEDGLHPNVITLNTMVDGMCKHGKVASAMGLVREMQKKGLEANATTYSSLINAFCNANNFDRAMQLFDEMPKGKSSKDAILYYTLIAGLSKAGRMEDASFIASSMKDSGFMLDITCYNILIGGLCRKKRLYKAYDLLNEMGGAGLKPNVVTYNTLITHFSKSGDFATAHSLMKKMTSEGHLPTVVTYGALIHSYFLIGKIDEAMEIFKDMSSSSKVPPNTVIYNILINSYCRSNEVEVALSLMDDMNGKGVKPNTNTYNTLLRGLRDINGLEKALELMDQMTGHGCNPNYMTMEILTGWLCDAGETEKFKRFVQGCRVSDSAA